MFPKPIGFYVYRSRLLCNLCELELKRLVVRAAARNNMNDLTGYMILEEGYFYQYFEGPTDACDRLFDRLITDPRHTEIKVLGSGLRYDRQFSSWSMATNGRTRLSAAPVGTCRSAIGRQLKYANGETVIDHLLSMAGRNWEKSGATRSGRVARLKKSFPSWQHQPATTADNAPRMFERAKA